MLSLLLLLALHAAGIVAAASSGPMQPGAHPLALPPPAVDGLFG